MAQLVQRVTNGLPFHACVPVSPPCSDVPFTLQFMLFNHLKSSVMCTYNSHMYAVWPISPVTLDTFPVLMLMLSFHSLFSLLAHVTPSWCYGLSSITIKFSMRFPLVPICTSLMVSAQPSPVNFCHYVCFPLVPICLSLMVSFQSSQSSFLSLCVLLSCSLQLCPAISTMMSSSCLHSSNLHPVNMCFHSQFTSFYQ
jgi:hypothetical protein